MFQYNFAIYLPKDWADTSHQHINILQILMLYTSVIPYLVCTL